MFINDYSTSLLDINYMLGIKGFPWPMMSKNSSKSLRLNLRVRKYLFNKAR